ncbi:MAG: bifunctional folylpolyglutamate synthase/dihydrofolate synthase, partial [Paludibacteraceae bacterium]|nr:bifunctional folylpolyglutamate synthase/dihydrofolate synthase [Paludibacteraceae bacterium]
EGFANVVTYTGLRGRWETLCEHPLTICDTGHNSHGVSSYIKQLNNLINSQSIVNSQSVNRQLHIVFGMVADKDIDDVLLLLPADANFYFTQPNSHRALPAQELLTNWRAIHPESTAKAYPSVAEALQAARAKATPDDVIFIGGSNYVVGEAIKYSYS